MDYKKYIADKIDIEGVSKDELCELIALPPNTEMGDYALPCFKFAKVLRKSPVLIAEELKNSIMSNIIHTILITQQPFPPWLLRGQDRYDFAYV